MKCKTQKITLKIDKSRFSFNLCDLNKHFKTLGNEYYYTNIKKILISKSGFNRTLKYCFIYIRFYSMTNREYKRMKKKILKNISLFV